MSAEFKINLPKIVLGVSLAFTTTLQLALSPLNVSANPKQITKEEKVDLGKLVVDNLYLIGPVLVLSLCGLILLIESKPKDKEKKSLTPAQEAKLNADYDKILNLLDQAIVIKILEIQNEIEDIHKMFENRVHSLCILGYLLEISDMGDMEMIKQLKTEIDERKKISNEALIKLKEYVVRHGKNLKIEKRDDLFGFYDKKTKAIDNSLSHHIYLLNRKWLSEDGYHKSKDSDSTKRLIESITPIIESLDGLYGNSLVNSVKIGANPILPRPILNRIQIASQEFLIPNFTLFHRQYLNMIIVLEMLQNSGENHTEWIKYLKIRYNDSLAWNEKHKAFKNLEDIKITLDSQVEEQIQQKVSQTIEDGYRNVLDCELFKTVNKEKMPEILAYICCVLWFGSSNIPFKNIRNFLTCTQVNPELHDAMLEMFKQTRTESSKLPVELQYEL